MSRGFIVIVSLILGFVVALWVTRRALTYRATHRCDDHSGHRALFVGNSLVRQQQVGARYETMVSGTGFAACVDEYAEDGAQLAWHANMLTSDEAPLADYLERGDGLPGYDVVVLQENSVMGAHLTDPYLASWSLWGASTLAAATRAKNAEIVLYMTWGYRHGVAGDEADLRTYVGMQRRIAESYRALAEQLAAKGHRVRIAPVGLAFLHIYESVEAAGGDPLAPGSEFSALYVEDGVHPSSRGGHLAACVIAGVATGADVSRFDDDPELGAEVSASLRAACAAVLQHELGEA